MKLPEAPYLPDLVKALLDPGAYPHDTGPVELAQTQMSFIFLGREYVYKVKKPVNLGYLDYGTLEKRLFFCRKEVELNRRLCDDIYLGVAAITREESDAIKVNGSGETLEYAVKMRLLPREKMMDNLLPDNRVSPQMVKAVAEKLADFHRKAETNPHISSFGGLDTVIQNTDENFSQTGQYMGLTISRDRYERIKGYTQNFITDNAQLFKKRAAEGKIRDCHGDLHAAHICFRDDICIYDCIEFNERFRYCDVASEISFLAMDLDHFGRAELSRVFVEEYVRQSGDEELMGLLTFYKCYRAYVRGKVEGFKINDASISEEGKATCLAVARSYFELAESYIV